jgi:RNA polymerase sigma-70 factor (ECF subfamily)
MHGFETCTDEILLQRMRAGEEEAFAALYQRLHGVVYRFARQMSGSAEWAEDVTQEVFLILLRKADLFDPRRGALSTYLIQITRNEMLRRLGRERLHESLLAEPEDEQAEAEAGLIERGNPLGHLLRSREIEFVRQAVLALPLHYREVVVLCDLEELNYAETAALLGCAVGTVRSRLHRARALLRDRLREQEATAPAAMQMRQANCLG